MSEPTASYSNQDMEIGGDLTQVAGHQLNRSGYAESGGTVTVVNQDTIHEIPLTRHWSRPLPPVLPKDMVRRTKELGEVAQLLADRWGTRLETPESLIGTMATVPLPAAAGSTVDEAAGLRDRLFAEHGIEVQMHAFRDRIHARISGQIYNTLEDVERLAEAVTALTASTV